MGNIEWMPIADLPGEFRDGRGLLLWKEGRAWIGDMNWNGGVWEPTHWAEINPSSADPGIPVHPTALVEKGIPGLATIQEATDDVLGKDGG